MRLFLRACYIYFGWILVYGMGVGMMVLSDIRRDFHMNGNCMIMINKDIQRNRSQHKNSKIIQVVVELQTGNIYE
ncbi:hypothetical protein VTN49DRAFT_3031 [Thermomyces lanuginosus]|uniref:uncharacterized protein n=1 Tax=Thermomyces lanuginosus TaxID=5541 RepID=UPI003742FE23